MKKKNSRLRIGELKFTELKSKLIQLKGENWIINWLNTKYGFVLPPHGLASGEECRFLFFK